MLRSDYVTNSNDSYWLSNPEALLEGYARIIGDERTARSLRTRIGLIMTRQQIEAGGFTRRAMQRMVFSNRQYAGELTRDAAGVCRSLSGGMAPTSDGPPVAIGNACDVLAAWDLRENLDSRGAILFRRFIGHASGAADLWSTPFTVSDPVNTPNTLNAGSASVRVALGDAISDLNAAGIALEARVGDVQGVTRGGRLIPVHGGPGDPHGQFNAIFALFDDASGYRDVEHGLLLRAGGHLEPPLPGRGHDPHLFAVGEPAPARHHSDQTRLFSQALGARALLPPDVAAGTRSTTVPRRRR